MVGDSKEMINNKQWYRLKNTITLITIFITILLFWITVDSLISKGTFYYLDYVFNDFEKLVANPIVTVFMTIILMSFDKYFTWAIPGAILFYLLFKKEWWSILALFLSIGGGEIMMSHLKNFFQRWSPMMQIIEGRGYSFPSGHAFYAMLVYGFMIYLAEEFIKSNRLKSFIFLLCSLLILLVGMSLISLNKHWFTEVFAGYCAGFSWLLISILLIKIIRYFCEAEGVER